MAFTAAVVTPASINFRDAKGNTASMRFYVPATGGPALTEVGNVFNAASPLSNAHVDSYTGQAAAAPAYGAQATYEDVEDKAVFTFQTAVGSLHRYQVPAPKSAIFTADGETVDSANALVITFVAAVIANIVGRSGEPITSYIGGARTRRKAHRRINIRTLSAKLDEPAL